MAQENRKKNADELFKLILNFLAESQNQKGTDSYLAVSNLVNSRVFNNFVVSMLMGDGMDFELFLQELPIYQSLERQYNQARSSGNYYQSPGRFAQLMIEKELKDRFRITQKGLEKQLLTNPFSILSAFASNLAEIQPTGNTALYDALYEALAKLDYSVAAKVKQMVSSRSGLSKQAGRFVTEFSELVQAYFDNLPPDQKAFLFEGYAGLSKATEAERIAFVLLNSGPYITKLAQLFYQNFSLPQLRSGLKLAEQNQPALPIATIRAVVRKEIQSLPENSRPKIVRIDPKPLATSGVAQVHYAWVLVRDPQTRQEVEQQVVLKVRKPSYLSGLESDIKILSQAKLSFDFQSSIWGTIARSNIEEGKLRLEGEKTARFSELYNRPDQKVGSSRLFDPIKFPPTDGLLVLEPIGTGYSVGSPHHLSPEEVQLKQSALENLFRVWLDTALFKAGGFNADPNGGNLWVSLDDHRTTAKFLDYGNVGQFTKTQQSAIIEIGKSLMLPAGDSKQNLTRALLDLFPDLNRLTPTQQGRLVEELSAQAGSSFLAVFEIFLKYSTKYKIEIPTDVAKFYRSLLLFKNQFSYLGDQMNQKGGRGNGSSQTAFDFEDFAKKILIRSALSATSAEPEAPSTPPRKSLFGAKPKPAHVQCLKALGDGGS